MGTLLGASRELFIVLGDPEHHHPRIGVVHLLGLSANLLGAVPPVLCVVDQTLASWGRNRTVRTAVPLSPHRDTGPVHGRGGFSRFRETPLAAMLQPWTAQCLISPSGRGSTRPRGKRRRRSMRPRPAQLQPSLPRNGLAIERLPRVSRRQLPTPAASTRRSPPWIPKNIVRRSPRIPKRHSRGCVGCLALER